MNETIYMFQLASKIISDSPRFSKVGEGTK